MTLSIVWWLIFAVSIMGLLVLDFRLFSGREREVSIREAAIWSVIWVVVALAFNAGVFFLGNHEQGVNFLTGYLVERALSMDNIFVFLLIFNYFKVPSQTRQNVLFWGIVLALVFRVIFIAAGVAIINAFHWTIYVLGAFLVFVGFKMFFSGDKEIDLDNNKMLRLLRRVVPVSAGYSGASFVVRLKGVRTFTPLVLVFLMVAVMDIVFAIDSIPAILAITTDPFVVYTSNIFAILGLRALFAVIAGLADAFRFLNIGLACILVLVGVKMVLADVWHVPVTITLAAVGTILLLAIAASVVIPSGDAHSSARSGSGKPE
ncbi:MAG: TerC/Alx family metal homeostasis membrane protein [Candidatus Omnitrophica bacterium]|nr:TerC/Alx family metal homeostasis membrane protein [Candidatus Omnitrophota bacterium]